jgi:PPM family protein phosphatase
VTGIGSYPDLEIGAATDPGRKRRSEPNQDAILVIAAENGRPCLLVVADGMGGHAGGATASRLVTSAIQAYYLAARIDGDLSILLGECIQAAHQALVKHAAIHPELAAMGSTIVLVAIREGQVYVSNVGDSRAYLIRDTTHGAGEATGTLKKPGIQQILGMNRARRPVRPDTEPEPGIELRQLSYDHSEVAELVRAGTITPLQALHSPRRNRLTQSLAPRRKEITPFIGKFAFTAGDVLLLCTDGLWGVIPEATLAAIAMELSPQAAVEKLIQQAVRYGGPDNVSVIIARTGGKPPAEEDTNPGF